MPQRIWVSGVAAAGERHDDVVVDLRDGRAVAAVALGAGAVGVEDHAIGAGRFVGEPLQQRGAEIEAHARVVVDDADDLVLAVGDARGAVGGVALGGDALVPVVVGRGGVLHFDGFEPGILAGRLVEVAVDADVMLRFDRGVGLAGSRHISFIIYWKRVKRLVAMQQTRNIAVRGTSIMKSDASLFCLQIALPEEFFLPWQIF